MPSLSIHIYTSKSILSIVCELQGSLPARESFQIREKKQRKTENILKSEEGLSRSHTFLVDTRLHEFQALPSTQETMSRGHKPSASEKL